jgi:hypothetical protein
LVFDHGYTLNWSSGYGIHNSFEIGEWNTILIDVIFSPGNLFNFIEFELGSRTSLSQTIQFEYLIDNLRLIYADSSVLIDGFGDGITSVTLPTSGKKVDQYFLNQNYPNPFNSNTIINFTIPEEDYVELAVYDINGKIVKTMVKQNLAAGDYSFLLDASDIATGIYFYRLRTKNFHSIKKLILLK